MFCHSCGKQEANDAKFCGECGAPLQTEPVALAESESGASNNGGASWSRWGIFIGIAIVVILWFVRRTELPSEQSGASRIVSTTEPATNDGATSAPPKPSPKLSPEERLLQLVKTNATLVGYVDTPTEPSITMSFSNGHLEYRFAHSDMVLASGPAAVFTSPDATCMGFEKEDRLGALMDPEGRSWKSKKPAEQILVCIAEREAARTVESLLHSPGKRLERRMFDFRTAKGEMFLQTYSQVNVFPAYYKAQVR